MNVGNKKHWGKVVSKILKTELTKRDISYKELAERLAALNIFYKDSDLKGRVSRGNFSAMLFIQCLRAIGVTNLYLEDSYFEEKDKY